MQGTVFTSKFQLELLNGFLFSDKRRRLFSPNYTYKIHLHTLTFDKSAFFASSVDMQALKRKSTEAIVWSGAFFFMKCICIGHETILWKDIRNWPKLGWILYFIFFYSFSNLKGSLTLFLLRLILYHLSEIYKSDFRLF